MLRKRHIGPLTSPVEWFKFLLLIVGADILSVVGTAWLIISVIVYFYPHTSPDIQTSKILFTVLVVGLIFGLWRRYPIRRVTERIPGRDVEVEIRVGKMLCLQGDFIISTTTSFDTDTASGTVASDSLIGQFIKEFYDNVRHLDLDIEQSLEGVTFTNLPSTWPGKKRKYEIGTVAQIRVQDHEVYLTAIADKNQYGNVSNSSFEDVKTSLAMAWEHISHRGEMGEIVIPLLGTGRSRTTATRFEAFKEIVKSFIAANADKMLCEKLIIVIHPKDYRQHQLDFRKMWEYLKSTCIITEFRTEVYSQSGTLLYEQPVSPASSTGDIHGIAAVQSTE